MLEIDLHNLTVDEAVREFIKYYNAHLNKDLRIIHGYGSSGSGGKIHRRLRSLMGEHPDKMLITKGEDLDCNPGYTIVRPRKTLPTITDLLSQEIIEFCLRPKVQEKIIGKFRKHGQKEVLNTLKKLEGQKLIKAGSKGPYKTWQKVD